MHGAALSEINIVSQVTPCATVFTGKWQLHQQAADPPVTVHLVNQLQQLFLGDRAWPHHCVTGNTCAARQMMHVRNTRVPFVDMCVYSYLGSYDADIHTGRLTQDARCSSFVLHIGTAGWVLPD